MKHIFLYALVFVFLMPVSALGLEDKRYTIRFGEGDFTYETINGLVHITSQRSDAITWGDSLSPALPCVIVNVLIAPSEEFARIVYQTDETLVQENVAIAPNPAPTPSSRQDSSSNLRIGDYEQTAYPGACVQYTGTHLTDGYKYLSFVVSPFRYDVANKNLYLNKSITLEVYLNSDNGIAKDYSCGCGDNMRNAVKSQTINGNELDFIYGEQTATKSKTSVTPSYQYIIITNELLRPTFEKLAQWKTIKGVRAKVITVEECYDEYPDDPLQLAIKKVLASYYSNGMAYTLLAGDTFVVPAQMCALPFNTIDSNETPCDLYYACLDGDISWDFNGNGILGETGDNPDLAPEFIVTRASVASLTDAEYFVERIIGYESAPKLEGMSNSMLSCGNYINGYRLKNNVYISDAQWQGEYVYENSVLPNWNCTLFQLFDTYTSHPDSANYAANPEHFQTELEKGYTFVDEFSHAWTTAWGALEYSTVYTVDDASELVNCGNSIISTISCYSNAFDKNTNDTICMSEAFMRNPESGILAYFGSSREGWLSYSYYFDEKFYESLLLDNNKQFGRATAMAKSALLGATSQTNNGNHYRWLEMTLNAMGDPEMPVFTCTPQNFQNVAVTYQNGSLSVSAGLDSCRICVSSVSDYGDSYYEVVDNTNTGNFINITNDCYLCITKPGYIPYIARVGPSVYLQNESVVRDLYVFSDNSYAGSDVTTEKAQGPVIIEKGKVTNRSSNGVFIKNDFEVKLGAEIEIITNP